MGSQQQRQDTRPNDGGTKGRVTRQSPQREKEAQREGGRERGEGWEERE